MYLSLVLVLAIDPRVLFLKNVIGKMMLTLHLA